MQRPAAFAIALAGIALSYRRLFAGEALAGRDLFRLFIPDATFLREELVHGRLAIWNPYLRLGQPFLATLQSQALYPPRVLCVLAFGPIWGLSVEQVLHVALAFAGAAWACRKLGASNVAASVGGAVFAFSRLSTQLAVQANIADAAAWSGVQLALALRLVERPNQRTATWLALAFAASLFAGSPETTLWQGLLCITAVIVGGNRRAIGWSVGALGVGGLAASAVLLPGLEFAAHSIRASEAPNALGWSLSWAQLLAAALPGFDQPLDATCTTDQCYLLSLFIGATPLLLAIVGASRRRLRWVAITALVLAALSLGAHLAPARWIIVHSPLSRFRYPAKYFVGAAFLVSVLAASGVDRLAALGRRGFAAWKWAGGFSVLFLALACAAWRARSAYGAHGAGWAAIFTTLLGTAVLVSRRNPRGRGAIAAMVFFELGIAALLIDPLLTEPAGVLSHPSLLARALPPGFEGRISVDPHFDWSREVPGAQSAHALIRSSRDALEFNRFMEDHVSAIQGYGAPEPAWIDPLLSTGRGGYDFAGVSFFTRWNGAPFADARVAASINALPTLWQTATAYPPAFVVYRARIGSDDEALDDIESGRARERVTLGETPTSLPLAAVESTERTGPLRSSRAQTRDERAGVTCTLADGVRSGQMPSSLVCARDERPQRYISVNRVNHGNNEQSGNTSMPSSVQRPEPTRIEIDVDASGDSYLIVTDAFYPGWQATLDEAPATILRADFAVRAVRVPAGHHHVVMRYAPASVRIGLILSALALLACAASLARRPKRLL